MKDVGLDLLQVLQDHFTLEAFEQRYITIFSQKKNNGKMILRIEDTDQNRLVLGAEDYIIKSLECGVE